MAKARLLFEYLYSTKMTELAENVADSSSSTAFDVDSAADLQVGQLIKINSEQMIITAISSNEITCTRGANSTDTQAHSTDDDVNSEIWTEPFFQNTTTNACVDATIRDTYLNPRTATMTI